MNAWLLVAGMTVLAASLADFVLTTIGAQRVGALTRRVAQAAWWSAKGVVRLWPGRPPAWMHRAVGPFVMTNIALVWIAGCGLGWTLIYAAANPLTIDGEPVGWLERFAYVGSQLSTDGSALAQPAETMWDAIAVFVAINGMVVLTLAVSFVLNVTSTVSQGRAFATMVGSVDVADERYRTMFLQQITSLATAVRGVPVSLCYSAARPERQLADAFLRFARDARADPVAFRAFKPALCELPFTGIEPNDPMHVVLEKLEGWAERYALSDAEPDRRKPEEGEEAHHVRHGGHEHA